jgi:hypothetical protein
MREFDTGVAPKLSKGAVDPDCHHLPAFTYSDDSVALKIGLRFVRLLD